MIIRSGFSRITPGTTSDTRGLLSRMCTVHLSSESLPLVNHNSLATSQAHRVELNDKACSYLEWQDLQIPCRHAIAVCNAVGKNAEDFIAEHYFIRSDKRVYKKVLRPIRKEGKEDLVPDQRT